MRISKFLSLFTVVFLTSSLAVAQCRDEGCGLVIRAKVAKIEVDRSDRDYVRFKIGLDVEFSNEGDRPIILFRPQDKSGYVLGGWHVYLEDEKKTRRSLLIEGYWQSVSGSEEYRDLAKKLDKKTPPSEYTLTLQPSEIWKSSGNVQLRFESKGPKYTCCVAWDEISTFPSKEFQMRITYELSPWNIEYFKPNLIRKLQKRWKGYGNVLVEKEKEGRFDHFRFSSEPISVDFSKATELQKP
ncbi:MAG: hypothetical protein IPM21_11675 [Acidobacteria bacterium]|nr:hypothetical protein [Acidobacteriota bacterium]